MKRVRQRIIINKDSTKAMWRRFTRLKRERPWVDCLREGGRERERQTETDRQTETETERESEERRER